jgi:Mg-chelatase subunit ChlD
MTAVMDKALRPEKVGVGESILVITDGRANNIETLENKIVEYTKEMKSKSELSVSFIQIGNNVPAKRWLKGLSKRLMAKKAEFDIVDVATTED